MNVNVKAWRIALVALAVLSFFMSFSTAHGQPKDGSKGREKDCGVWLTAGHMLKDFSRIRSGRLETPTRDPENWRGTLDYEHIYDVARATVGDFFRDENLFTDFEKICVFTTRDEDRLVSTSRPARGVASYIPNYSRDPHFGRVDDLTGVHRVIFYNTHDEGSSAGIFLHELGHHIASYVDGAIRYPGTKFRRRCTAVKERMAAFWQGAILYRLEKEAPEKYRVAGMRKLGFAAGASVRNDPWNRLRAFREGWDESEFSDTWLWRYGTYDYEWLYACPGAMQGEQLSSIAPGEPIIIVD